MNTAARSKNKEQQIRQAALKHKLDELIGSTQRDELKIETAPDALDQVISSANRELAVTQLEVRTRLLWDVRAALTRIEEGTYGFCGECEEPIPAKRLDAVPWARLCVRCQERAEAQVREEAVDIGVAA